MQSPTLRHFWDNTKRTSTSRSVNGEISPVQCKYRFNFLAARKINQGYISVLRVNILIPLHERRDCFGLRPCQRQ